MFIDPKSVKKVASFSLFIKSTSSLNYASFSLYYIFSRRATLSDKDFLKCFRGLVHVVGCFIIRARKK